MAAPAPAAPAKKSSTSRMMFLMPLLFLMNRLDLTNPSILWPARIAFVVTQLLSLGVFYLIQRRVLAKNDTRKIFVPGAKSPFDQSPNYAEVTETTYVQHEANKCQEFMKQTLIGAAIAGFVHLKMGVNQVVLIQAIMSPMNLYDNPLVQPWIFGKREGRIWNEKLEGEPLDAPEAAETAPEATSATVNSTPAKKADKPKMSLAGVTPAEAIAQALAQEAEADFDDVWEVVKKDVNATTPDDKWTALMVACGSPLDTDDFIRKIITAGADVAAVDSEGWTALHWSAFHGRPEAAETLLSCASPSKLEALLAAKDSNDRTALTIAKEEGNNDVVEIIEKAKAGELKEDEEEAALRRRKPATSVEDVD